MIVVLKDTQCISFLSHYCKEMTDRKQTDNGKGLSWLTVRHHTLSEEIMAAGTRGSLLSCIHRQKVDH